MRSVPTLEAALTPTRTLSLVALPLIGTLLLGCEPLPASDEPVGGPPSASGETVRDALLARVATDFEPITIVDDRTFTDQAYDDVQGDVLLCGTFDVGSRTVRLQDVEGELNNLCPAGSLVAVDRADNPTELDDDLTIRNGSIATTLGALNGEGIGVGYESGNVGIDVGDAGEWLISLDGAAGAYLVVTIVPEDGQVAFDVCVPAQVDGRWDIDCDGSGDV